MIINEEHLEAVEYEHKQTVLRGEVDMLNRMIDELEAKKDELLANLEKLTIVRDALADQIDPDQLELDLDS